MSEIEVGGTLGRDGGGAADHARDGAGRGAGSRPSLAVKHNVVPDALLRLLPPVELLARPFQLARLFPVGFLLGLPRFPLFLAPLFFFLELRHAVLLLHQPLVFKELGVAELVGAATVLEALGRQQASLHFAEVWRERDDVWVHHALLQARGQGLVGQAELGGVVRLVVAGHGDGVVRQELRHRQRRHLRVHFRELLHECSGAVVGTLYTVLQLLRF
mmetsp:Transcript_47932/g.96523  ORF Transcript_47932/g.96523 Transcript_47932/m.96523 type:complete len:217 (+) Transcript_47932:139-789(+)